MNNGSSLFSPRRLRREAGGFGGLLEENNDNHYLAYLGLDGWVYFSAFRNGNFVELKSGP